MIGQVLAAGAGMRLRPRTNSLPEAAAAEPLTSAPEGVALASDAGA
jgi:dTDP-glucose pyrophosphorylase